MKKVVNMQSLSDQHHVFWHRGMPFKILPKPVDDKMYYDFVWEKPCGFDDKVEVLPNVRNQYALVDHIDKENTLFEDVKKMATKEIDYFLDYYEEDITSEKELSDYWYIRWYRC